MPLKQLVRRLGLEGLARWLLLRLLIAQQWLIDSGVMRQPIASSGLLVLMGNAALAQGQHQRAIDTYQVALRRSPEDSQVRLQVAVATYLAGDYRAAERWFVSCEQARMFDVSRWGIAEARWRVLDESWLLAIGHIAFLDTYVKAVRLGWLSDIPAVLAYDAAQPPPGWPLFRYFGAQLNKHLRIVPSVTPEIAIDATIHGSEFRHIPERRRAGIRTALSQPFWYGPDDTGRIRWFGPYAAAVQAAWQSTGQGRLLSLDAADRAVFRRTMEQVYGLPSDAWFVVLHVREPGYHAGWHRHHPATRNADIRSYTRVIDFITSKGGWVVRGGDPSMRPLEPREQVIDYATSQHRSPEIDILLCADCTYFVGTNSGYGLVPPVFGKRVALTNWSPIAAPNWYPGDIVIPKPIRRRQDRRLLSFDQLLRSAAGWSQFERDFAANDLTIEDNEPDDLAAVVEELHNEVFAPTSVDPADAARLQRFNEIVVSHGAYVGSRMSYRFLAKYAQLLE